MSDEDPVLRKLMAAAQRGESASYARLLETLLPILRRAAHGRWRAASPADIEDVVQETLLALHNARHLHDPARPVLPFVLGILKLRGADVLRRRHRLAARESALDDLPETSTALATNSEQEEVLDAGTLRASIERFSPGQRQAIEMTKLQGMSLEEASLRSGMSIAALKVATHRGLLALRKRLGGGQ